MLSKIESLMKKTTPPPVKSVVKISPPKARIDDPGKLIKDSSVKDIIKIFNMPKEDEVEVSFGKFLYNQGRINFVPGVTQGEFEELLKILRSLKLDETSSTDKVEIDENTHIRKITSFEKVSKYQRKERSKDKIENMEWGYRISSSKEIDIRAPTNFKPTRVRNRRRFAFISGNYQLDLTQVTSPGAQPIYEVEIERIKIETDDLIKNLQNIIEIVLLGLTGKKQSDSYSILMNMKEKEDVIKKHNYLFSTDKFVRAPKNDFNLVEGYWNKPQNIKKDDILMADKFNFSVTVKLDGKRKFLFVTNNTLYVCAPPYDIKAIFKDKSRFSKFEGVLLDCEEVKGVYYVFDILFSLKSLDVRGESFQKRRELFNEVVEGFNLNIVKAKEFFTGLDFYTLTKKALNSMKKSDRPTDGLVYQPDSPYKNKDTKKWKPTDQLTIDFKLGNKEGRTFLPFVAKYDKNIRKDVIFKGSFKNPLKDNIIQIPKGEFKGFNLEGMVAECKYNHKNEEFEVVRLREDKAGVPNEVGVAMSVWDDIVDPIREETIKGQDLVIMRRMHNLCKATLLSNAFKKGDVIMDWGSGRGGDLGKWSNLGLSKVFVVEPNEENYQILSDRKDGMKMRTEIVPVMDKKDRLVGGQNTKDLIKTIENDKLNGLVSFFSLTFFGKDKETFNAGIQSIASVLPNKGDIFIGIVMDSKKTLNLTKGFQYKTKAFSITPLDSVSRSPKEGHNEIQITINDPSSMVDYTEWLFPFDLFKERLELEGFKCEKDGYLDEDNSFPKIHLKGKEYSLGELYNNLGVDAQNFSSINHFFIFQRVKSTPKKSSPKSSTPKKSSLALENFERIRVVDNSFFNAVLSAFDKKYINMDKKEKRLRVEKVKKMLSGQLTMDIFKNLAKGCVFKAEIQKVLLEAEEDLDDEELEERALEEFQDEIMNRKDIDYRKIMSHFADLIKINIIVLGDKEIRTKVKYPKSIYLLDKKGKIYLLKKGDSIIFKR